MINTTTNKCRICLADAHGIHFGVYACRACAAFFRRTVVSRKTYTCKKSSAQCSAENGGRLSCRYCRFKKCMKCGMTTENVKLNYDTTASIKPDEIPDLPEIENDDEMKIVQQFDEASGKMKIKIDITELLNTLKTVFSEFRLPVQSNYEQMTTLDKMSFALEIYRNRYQSNEIEFITHISFDSVLRISNSQIKSIARWMMHFKQFRLLQIDDRIRIIKTCWVQWKRLERFAATACFFGRRMIEENIVTVLPGKVALAGQLEVDYGFINFDKITNGFKQHMFKFNNRMMYEVGKPLVELNPTLVEVAFMLAQLTWHISGKVHQGEILVASDEALEEITTDLHTYYITNRTRNYAYRLVKIMNIVNATQKIHSDRINFIDIIRIFDVFNVEASDPEIFKSYF